MLRAKRAQVGETMTWVIATIIIIVILILAIFVSVLLPKTTIGSLQIDKGDDLLKMRTSLPHELANDKNKNAIDEWLEEENEP